MRISLSGGAFQSTAHNFRQQVFSRAFRRRSACDGGGSGADAGLVRGPRHSAAQSRAYPFRIDPFFFKKGYEPIGRDGPAPLGVGNGRLPDIKDSRRFRPRLARGGLKNAAVLRGKISLWREAIWGGRFRHGALRRSWLAIAESNCRELITALGQRIYSPTRRCCIHRTPDIYGPALKSRKKIWFFVGCKHIFGVSLCWQRPDGVYALSFLYSVSASLRQSGVQVFRKPVRPFFHLFFLATLGKLLCR